MNYRDGWQDPEWRKYYGMDDDSFYDEEELENDIFEEEVYWLEDEE